MTASVPHSGENKDNRLSNERSRYPRWLNLPEPLRRVFNKFPMITYDENHLPQRTLQQRKEHVLYIFAAAGTTDKRVLSFNPACLKWQSYLLLKRIPFILQPANNHAAPTGSLPFLIPATKADGPPSQPISSGKLQRWIALQGVEDESPQMRLEPYSTLIDQNVRHAWLLNLYLTEENFSHIAKPLYIESCSTNIMVQWVLEKQLKGAAQEQLLSNQDFIDVEEVYRSVDTAFQALNTLLGDDYFFYSPTQPGLFDASLFAFTYPLVQLAIEKNQFGFTWRDRRLSDIFLKHQGLVDHQFRMAELCTDDK